MKQKGLGVIVAGFALLLVAGLGMYGYVLATMTPLHPDAQAVSSVAHAAPPVKWTDAVDRARQTVRASVAEHNVPGLSVAIAIDGELVWAEGFGWADLEKRVPVAPDTPFRIGTAGKVITSAAVGVLLERDRVNLDDEIQAYVPTFPRKEWPVTLRQAMGHLAGIRRDAGDEEPLGVQEDTPLALRCERALDGVQRFAEYPLLFQPGTEFRYSNYGWVLVSAAVEAAAERPFAEFMRTAVFEPLGMNDTTAQSSVQPNPDLGPFYFPRFAADPRYGPDEGREIDDSCFSGSAAMLSTPSDLVRFGMAVNGEKLLRPATVQLLQTSQRLPSGQETGYGLGWDVESVTLSGEKIRAFGHDGGLMGGPVSSLMTIPDRGIVVAVTSNIGYTDTRAIATRIAEAFAAQK